MEIFNFTFNYIFVFLIVLSILVFVHEWGHYRVAIKNGVRVEVFSIGFGPELFGWTNTANTRWKVCAIPLGGYVKMFGEGEENEEGEPRELTDDEKAVSFSHKTVGQRAAIIFAGPAINFIFAAFLLAIMAGTVGTARPLAGVGEIMASSAAEKAGLIKGDRIIAIDGQSITWFEDLRKIVSKNPGKKLNFTIQRNTQTINIPIIPETIAGAPTSPNDGAGQPETGRLGVAPDAEQIDYIRQNPIMALWTGIRQTGVLSVRIVSYVGDIISGNRSAKELGGVLRIAQVSGQMAQNGFLDVVFLMALLSINLGVINLFPIPVLDGGHLLFLGFEAIRGKPLGANTQEYGFRFGLILLLILFVYVTWNDLIQLQVIEFVKELIT